GAERLKLALSSDDLFHRSGTEAADELVLEVDDADVETVRFHAGAREVGAEAGTLETALEKGLLCGVAHARQAGVESLGAEHLQEPSDRLSTADRNDRDPLGARISPEELRERLALPPPEDPVAFDEILDGLERDVLPFVARISHPAYLAFIPGEGTWPGALGDLIASALNVDTCWWLGASGPSALELV